MLQIIGSKAILDGSYGIALTAMPIGHVVP
jgi:hypothetical protein